MKGLSIPAVSEQFGVSYRTVFRLIKSGKLRAGKVAGVWRIDQRDLDAYFQLQRAAAHAPTVDAAVTRAFDADEQLGPSAGRFS